MRSAFVLIFTWLHLAVPVSALSLNEICLRTKLAILENQVDGRIGICVFDGQKGISIRGSHKFPLSSVLKLPVAVAVLSAVDKEQLHLTDPVTTANGVKTTIRDLLVGMIVNNDGMATDLLMKKAGGPAGIQTMLEKKGLPGFRIDRDERELEAEGADHNSYASRHHNLATPDGVATLLLWLANGQLLSPSSSALLLEAMSKTHASPDLLQAGVPPGWLLAHKTGTSGTWHGVTGATNDVGILIPDRNSFIAVAVFIADSHASERARTQLIADVAQAVGTCSQ